MAKFIQLNIVSVGTVHVNVDQILVVFPNVENRMQVGAKLKLSNEILIVRESVAEVLQKINN